MNKTEADKVSGHVAAAIREMIQTYDSRLLFAAFLANAAVIGERLIRAGVVEKKEIEGMFAQAYGDALTPLPGPVAISGGPVVGEGKPN